MPFLLALKECDQELRDIAFELIEPMNSGELDEHELRSSQSLLAEMLFPNADARGVPGLDLVEAEAMARTREPEAAEILHSMDAEEASFAERLSALMAERGLTQAELATKIGVGQPAILMMLNRSCRPQRKTVAKLAVALSVTPERLWPKPSRVS